MNSRRILAMRDLEIGPWWERYEFQWVEKHFYGIAVLRPGENCKIIRWSTSIPKWNFSYNRAKLSMNKNENENNSSVISVCAFRCFYSVVHE